MRRREWFSSVAAGVCLGSVFASSAAALDTSATTNTGTLLILPFHNDTGDTNSGYWSQGAPGILRQVLGEKRTLEVMNSRDAEFAYSTAGVPPDSPLSPGQVRDLASSVRANAVVWGSYRTHAAGKASLDLNLLSLTRHSTSRTNISAGDWLDLLRAATVWIVEAMPLTLSEGERQRMGFFWPRSNVALETYAKAGANFMAHGAPERSVVLLRETVKQDPEFAAALLWLARFLKADEKHKVGESEKLVQQMLNLPKQVSHGYCELSELRLLLNAGDENRTQTALEEAARREPDCYIPMWHRALWFTEAGKYEDALTFLRQARTLRPNDGSLAACMGLVLLASGQREAAMQCQKEAVRMARNDLGAYGNLIRLAVGLGSPSEAAEYYRKVHAIAQKQNATEEAEDIVEELNFFPKVNAHVSKPRSYSEEELEEELETRLRSGERNLVVNPLEANEPMKAWARELTRGAQRPIDKLLLLTFGLEAKKRVPGPPAHRTARQLFEDWNKEPHAFSCEERTSLLVALARAVGLEAFVAYVSRDSDGKLIDHQCAVVFLETGALVAEFGQSKSHKEFVVLDDLQAIAHYVSCTRKEDGNDVARSLMGVKVHDFPLLQARLVQALAAADQLDEALAIVAALKARDLSDTELAQVLYAEGNALTGRKQYHAALEPLTRLLQIAPESLLGHVLRGFCLVHLGRTTLAMEDFRQVVALDDGFSYQEMVNEAKRTLEEFGVVEDAHGGDTNSLSKLKEFAASDDPMAQHNLGVVLWKSTPPGTAEAITWFHRAADQGHEDSCHVLYQIYLRGEGVPCDEAAAMKWLRKAAEAGLVKGMHEWGNVLYSGKLVEKNSVQAYKWLRLALGKGDMEAKFILRELDLFMTPEELRQAKDDKPPEGWKN